MAYLAPIHRPSSVRHAIKLNFLSPQEENLIVAKSNRLEIYSIGEDGLSLQHTKALYGKVTILQKIQVASSATDHIFVGTDRYMYFTLSWDSDTKQLRTEKSYVDVADKSSRDSQTGDRCLIDPTRSFLTLELYEGIVTVVPFVREGKRRIDVAVGTLGEPVPSRIEELFVRSSAFLQLKSPRPRMAFLYEDSQQRVRIKIRELVYSPGSSGDPGSAELKQLPGSSEELELGSSHIIPVSEPAFGLLILGETSITYIQDETYDTITRPLEEATIFVAWEQIDSQRYILADEYGKLYLLMLISIGSAIKDWKLDVLGETSRASTLVYLDGGRVFVGSHQGDSQVIEIQPESLKVIQTFQNIAPILDFTIMDMGNRTGEGQSNEYSSGQARIVTGSGAFKDGSLRSVRSGVGLEYLDAIGDFEHISNLFSLKSASSLDYADTLVVSLLNETRVFCFYSNGEAAEVDEFKGMVLSESTLLASTPKKTGTLLQITDTRRRITDLESAMVVSEWTTEDSTITAVAANERHTLLCVGGVRLVLHDLLGGNDHGVQREFGTDNQIACVALPESQDNVCFVGFWQGSTISVLSLSTLEAIQTITVSEESLAVPRSLLLTQIFPDQPPTLFVALADGNVVTFSVDPEKDYALYGKKSIILGTQQANFRALPRGDGLNSVFAISEHPSVIYGQEGRLVCSAVTAEDATCVCPFNSELYPEGAIAIATAKDLQIAYVESERTTHVQTLLVRETVRRIAYSPTLKAFGLGTISRAMKNGEEIVQSHFKLTDEIAFMVLDMYWLNKEELVESVMRCELNDGHDGLAERFVVGTAYLDEEGGEAIRGRIIIFEVTADRQFKLVHEEKVKGGCRCLAMVEGKIVAALIKTVVVYSFEYDTPSSPHLVKKATFRTSTAPIDIYVNSNTIAVADLMKSISILQYKCGEIGLPDKLEEVARHFQTTWGTAVAEVAENTYLESDAEGNLMVLQRQTASELEDDKRRLQVTSEMLLGEMVNRIRRVDVATAPNSAVIPRAFLATVEGSIYLFALISPSKQNLLMNLQSNLAECVQSPGHVPFLKYRAFKNQVREEEEPSRFVDGELIERFLDCDEEVQRKAIAGLDTELEEVRGLVEQLRRLH